MIKNYFDLLRVPHWIKNLFVFVPLLFSKHLFDVNLLLTSLSGFFIFCLASSFIYIINDIVDLKADSAHPVKKLRPLPSGRIPVKNGWITSIVLLVILIVLLIMQSLSFILISVVFILLNVFYSLVLKHIVILDVFSIAAGFSLRVVAGALIINVPISSWLILTTMFISLFLGVMKRHSELIHKVNSDDSSTRKVLAEYSRTFANQMATVSAAGVVICYALYTVSQRTILEFGTENLIYTTPFVVFGIFRFMYLEYMNQKGENTTGIMLTDLPMIVNVLFYLTISILIIYNLL